MAFLHGVGDVNVSLIRSVTNMIPERSNVLRLILLLHVSSIFSAAKETLKPLKSPCP